MQIQVISIKKRAKLGKIFQIAKTLHIIFKNYYIIQKKVVILQANCMNGFICTQKR